MSRRKRSEAVSEIELAAGVPDARAILDADGDLIGWDESAANAYCAEHGLVCFGQDLRGAIL